MRILSSVVGFWNFNLSNWFLDHRPRSGRSPLWLVSPTSELRLNRIPELNVRSLNLLRCARFNQPQSQVMYEDPTEEENMQQSKIVRREFLKDTGLVVAGPVVALSVFPAAGTAGAEAAAGPAAVQSGKVELELLNPLGVIDPPPMLGINPRLKTLEGKKLAMIHNNKAGAKEFLIAVEELLKAKYPSMTFTHFDTNINLADTPEKYAEMAKSCDAFILGSGD